MAFAVSAALALGACKDGTDQDPQPAPSGGAAPGAPEVPASAASDSVSTPASYTLTVQPSTNGTITGTVSNSSYAAGTAVTLTATSDGTYGLNQWLGDAASCGSAPTCTVTMNGHKTVGAIFKTVPVGYGAAVTGGAGGQVVDVSTAAELKAALCNAYNGSICVDTTPRIIRVTAMIDFIGQEGTTTGKACVYSHNNCSLNGKQEKILDWNAYCADRTLFDLTYDSAGGSPLRVGSNKTVIGVGKAAGVKGKGFYLRDGVSNVIIRNLNITDINDGVIWGGDAITIDGASDVWIDHNYIARIGRQMIVTGWGPADRVTISNNVLDGTTDYGHYCDGRSYWFMLLIAEGQTLTIIGNKIYNSSGRAPEVGRSPWALQKGMVHLVNNLYDSNFWMGLGASDDVATLVEANDFTSTPLTFYPIFSGSETNLVFAPLQTNTDVANGYCTGVLSRNCMPNSASNSTVDFVVNPAVTDLLRQNATWRQGAAAVRPIPAASVRARVNATAGPQLDPDS
ncbi:pectin lyase [Roseateles sp. YR242]|nr:pectin lyase [Roseateles sp. YR242]